MPANVSRLGQVNAIGMDSRELFLKVFAGEVLAAFERKNIMLPLTTVRTISHGKSAQFPATGRIDAGYHVPGTPLAGLPVNHAERVITIDELLVSHAFIADIDEAMNHYEVRSIYSTEMGRKLATTMDENILRNIILGARVPNPVVGLPGGTEIENDLFTRVGVGAAASLEEQTDALASALFTSAQTLDEHDIPDEGRFCVLRPEHYYVLAQNLDMINRWYGGTGAVSEGTIIKVAGIEIKKSNNVPSTDVADPYHAVDASKTIGVVATKESVGTVKLMDLSMQTDWDIRRQGTWMVARYAVGHGYLRPDCAIELKLDNLDN